MRLSEKEQEARAFKFLDEIDRAKDEISRVKVEREARRTAWRERRRKIRKLGLNPDGKSCLYCDKFVEQSGLCTDCSQKWFGDAGRRQSMSREENDRTWDKVFEAIRIKKARDSGSSLLDDYFGGEAGSKHQT